MDILIITGRFGQGHWSAARAFEQHIHLMRPDARVTVADLWQQALGDAGSRRVYRLFGAMVRRGGPVYDKLYSSGEPSFRPIWPLLMRAISRLVEEYRPQVVISTLPQCTQLAAAYKQRGASYTLVSCITDVSCHRQWTAPVVDLYCAASAHTAQMLRQWGVAPEQILITGVPVRPAFRVPAAGQRQSRHILVMGGGLGLMPTEQEFYQDLAAIPNVQVTVATGQNQGLSHKLAGLADNLHQIGEGEDLAYIMARCDLLLSKPGGSTIFEAIACGLPLLAFAPKLEQEKENADFVRQQGIGLVLPAGRQTSCWVVEDLLQARSRLEEMRQQTAKLRAATGLDVLGERLGLTGRCRQAGD